MIVLGIETSWDDTSLALFDDERRKIIAELTAAQLVHERYGGVVPEIASRAHIEQIYPVISEAMEQAGTSEEDIDAVAVANQPGLTIACYPTMQLALWVEKAAQSGLVVALEACVLHCKARSLPCR